MISRFLYCFTKAGNLKSAITLTYAYLKFSFLIRNKNGHNKLVTQRTHKIKLYLNNQLINLNFRIQDLPLIFEIFHDQNYGLDIELTESDWIVDLGANIGLTTLFFRYRYDKDIPILSIEPSRNNIKLLEYNLQNLNKVTIHKAAISNTNNKVPFIDSGLGYNAKIGTPKESSYEVESITMNSLIDSNNIQTIGLLKIDIEGGEKQLFNGNTEWLSLVKNLLIEIHDEDFIRPLKTIASNHGLDYKSRQESILYFAKR